MKPNFTLFSDSLDYALGWMVVHTLWQATLIAFISGILMVAMRKKAAKTRYIVANIALLAVVVSAVVTFCLYYDFASEPAKVSFTPTTDLMGAATKNVSIAAEIPTPKSEIANPLSIQGFKDYFNHNIPLIVTIWILGVAVFMLKLLGGISYIYYLKNRMNFPADEYWTDMLQKLSDKAGVQRGIDIVESAMVRTPMVVGHLKPMIMFPMGIINRLAPEEVEAILAHELAHVMRKDFIFNILQSVVEALFYFHPAVWWLSSQISNERESACDDIAIELINSKINYARALVAIQEMAYFPLTPSLAFAGQRKSQFLMRMQRILNQPNNKTNIMEKLIATCALVLLMVGLSFGGNNADTPSVSEPQYEEIDLNLYVYLPNRVDSLRVPTEVIDGNYTYEDNTQKAELTVKNSYVVALKVNDTNLKEEQFINYKRLIDKILRIRQSPSSNKITTTPNLITEPGTRITLDNVATVIDLDKMGGADMDISENGDGSMIIKGKDGSRVVVENTEDGKQIVTSSDRYGNTTKTVTDKNGNTITENYSKNSQTRTQSFINNDDNGGSTVATIDDNGNKSTVNSDKNGATTVENYSNGRVAKTYINGNVVTTIDEDGRKSVIDKDNNGNTTIKNYDKNDKFLDEIVIKGNKAYLNGRLMTDEELRTRSWMNNANGINRVGGFSDVQSWSSNSNTNENPKKLRADYTLWHSALMSQAKKLGDKKDPNIYWTVKQTLDAAANALANENPSVSELAAVKDKLEWVRKHLMQYEEGGVLGGAIFNKSTDVQSHRNSLKNRHKVLYDKAINLKRAGTDIMAQVTPTFNEVGKELSKDNITGEDIGKVSRKLDWIETFIDNKSEHNDTTEELEGDIKDLQSDIKELRKEIKECACQDNFDFRMGLIEEIDRLFPVTSSRNRNVFNAFEKRFLDIKNRWEKGECDDFKQNQQNNRNNNSNGTSSQYDARIKNIVRKAEKLVDEIDACDCKSKDPNWVIWAKARLDAQYALTQSNKNEYGLKLIENEIATIEKQFNRLKNQSGTTNCQGCPPGNGQNHTVYSTSPNGYSYGTGTSRADAERAQKDAQRRTEESRQRADTNRAQRDNDKDDSGIAIHTFFQNLLDMGYISFNKQCAVTFTNTELAVDGKNITGRDFERIIKDFDNRLSGKKKFNINYTGKIKGSINNLSIQGSLNTSIF